MVLYKQKHNIDGANDRKSMQIQNRACRLLPSRATRKIYYTKLIFFFQNFHWQTGFSTQYYSAPFGAVPQFYSFQATENIILHIANKPTKAPGYCINAKYSTFVKFLHQIGLEPSVYSLIQKNNARLRSARR